MRWRGRFSCGRPLHRPQRWAERGALRCAQAAYAMHVHAYHHFLTLTNSTVTGRTLHQPRAYTSTDVCEPALLHPAGDQAAPRPPERRKAAAVGCRGGHHGGQSGHCSRCRSLHGRAGCRRRPCRVGMHGWCACGASAACPACRAAAQPRRVCRSRTSEPVLGGARDRLCGESRAAHMRHRAPAGGPGLL